MAVSKRTRKPKAAKSKAETQTTSAPAAQTPAKITTRAIDIDEAIRTRAYQYYEQRGFEHGADLEDWLRAEADVLAHFGARTA